MAINSEGRIFGNMLRKIKVYIAFLLIGLSFTLSACRPDDETRAVVTLIDSIGVVTLDSEGIILDAETAYTSLTDRQKRNVNNSGALFESRAKLDELIRVHYLSALQSVYTEIQLLFAGSQTLSSTVITVWQNAIRHSFANFSQELTRLYAGQASTWGGTAHSLATAIRFRGLLDEMIELNEELNLTMASLANPPEEYRDMFTSVVALFSSVRNLFQHVENPTGNIGAFSDGRTALVNEINQQITVIELTHPEIIK